MMRGYAGCRVKFAFALKWGSPRQGTARQYIGKRDPEERDWKHSRTQSENLLDHKEQPAVVPARSHLLTRFFELRYSEHDAASISESKRTMSVSTARFEERSISLWNSKLNFSRSPRLLLFCSWNLRKNFTIRENILIKKYIFLLNPLQFYFQSKRLYKELSILLASIQKSSFILIRLYSC